MLMQHEIVFLKDLSAMQFSRPAQGAEKGSMKCGEFLDCLKTG
jgi:hypothetical protein